MALKEMPKVGEQVRYLGGDDYYADLTIDNIYEVNKIDSEGIAWIEDDRGDNAAIEDSSEYRDLQFFELVEETPSVTDLIANLGRRVHELEGDAVNHPQHYTRGKFETIEVIEHMTQGYTDPFVAYCVGNSTKYIDRAPYKHGSPAEDLRKAAWYLTRAADHIDAKAGDSVE